VDHVLDMQRRLKCMQVDGHQQDSAADVLAIEASPEVGRRRQDENARGRDEFLRVPCVKKSVVSLTDHDRGS
jgi:hypothetical protein